MEKIFKDLLEIPDVLGVLFKGKAEGVAYQNFRSNPKEASYSIDRLEPLLTSLDGIQEADVIFANLRLYFRQVEAGHLLVVMNRAVPIAMVRLHCDMIIPRLATSEPPTSKKFWGFLRK